MSWEIADAEWQTVRGKLKSRWGKLTNAHLDVIAGKREGLATRLQDTYAISAEEAEKQIASFESHTKELRPKTVS